MFMQLLKLALICSIGVFASTSSASVDELCSKTDRSKEHAALINGLQLDEVTKCSQEGDAVALNELGVRYGTGKGAKKDSKRSFENYLAAAGLGDTQSKFNLGFMYHGGEGTAQDYPLAIRWLNEAANEGSASAQHLLGYIYATGEGADKNGSLAEKWFLAAAKQGNVLSQQALIRFYSDGELVPKNLDEAVKWTHRARDANLYGEVWRESDK